MAVKVKIGDVTKKYLLFENGNLYIEGSFTKWENNTATELTLFSNYMLVKKVYYCVDSKELEIRGTDESGTDNNVFPIVNGILLNKDEKMVKSIRYMLASVGDQYQDLNQCYGLSDKKGGNNKEVGLQPEVKKGKILTGVS